MEEFFPEKDKLFAQTVQKLKGKQGKFDKTQQRIRPKIPKGAQHFAAKGEEKHHAAEEADQLIDAQLTPCGAQSKEKQQRQHAQAIEHIQRRCSEGVSAAPPPRPQQVIHKSQCPAQQRRLQRKAQLQETIDLHTAAFQPKRRCKMPRWDSCSS